LGVLDKLRVSKRELIIGIVLAIVISFIIPPIGVSMLILAMLGLIFVIIFVGVLTAVFGPKNVTNLIIAWLATKSAERISDKFSPRKGLHNPHARASFLNLLSLSPEEFEEFCADLLKRMGYRDVRWVGGSGDMGLDVICSDEYGGRVGVQCKRYSPSRKVTAKEVREFIGALSLYGCDSGILFTTSDLTDEAWEEVRIHGNITVIDGFELRRMLNELS